MGSKEQLNLQVLQRFDGNIAQVLQTVGHVTLYNFNQEQQIWVLKLFVFLLVLIIQKGKERS